jgi:MYXO-CTERM domain-containing protein
MPAGPFAGFQPTFNGVATFTGITTAVPEADSYAMMLAGLGLVGFAARRRQQKALAA